MQTLGTFHYSGEALTCVTEVGWGLCCVCVNNYFENYLTFSLRNSSISIQHAKIYLQAFK